MNLNRSLADQTRLLVVESRKGYDPFVEGDKSREEFVLFTAWTASNNTSNLQRPRDSRSTVRSDLYRWSGDQTRKLLKVGEQPRE